MGEEGSLGNEPWWYTGQQCVPAPPSTQPLTPQGVDQGEAGTGGLLQEQLVTQRR